MLICYEGLDGVGKSTVSKQVSKNLGIRIIEKPVKDLLYINPKQSKQITENLYSNYSSKVQAMYYLMGYLSAIEDSRKENLLMDRGLLSTYYFSFNDENSFLFDSLVNNCDTPELTFLLYASIEERIKRIQERNTGDQDLEKRRIYRDGYDRFFEGIERYKLPYMLINTERLKPEEVSQICQTITQLAISGENIDQLKDLFSIANLEHLGNMDFQHLSKSVDERVLKKSL